MTIRIYEHCDFSAGTLSPPAPRESGRRSAATSPPDSLTHIRKDL
jgi:hypothetical protein